MHVSFDNDGSPVTHELENMARAICTVRKGQSLTCQADKFNDVLHKIVDYTWREHVTEARAACMALRMSVDPDRALHAATVQPEAEHGVAPLEDVITAPFIAYIGSVEKGGAS